MTRKQQRRNEIENLKRWSEALKKARAKWRKDTYARMYLQGGKTRFKPNIMRCIGLNGEARTVGQKNVARVRKKKHIKGYWDGVRELANSFYDPLPTR